MGNRDNLWDRLKETVANALELRVVTVVGPLTIQNFDDQEKPLQVTLGTAAGEQNALFTSINLLTGDIRTAISPKYEREEEGGMRDFHAEQVAMARDIVADNLRTLCDIAKDLPDLFERPAG